MNLFYSSITSALIVTGVWFAAVSQPSAAIAGSFDPDKNMAAIDDSNQSTQNEKLTKQKASVVENKKLEMSEGQDFSEIEIIGNTQTTMLSKLEGLLAAFTNNESVNTKLYQQPSKIYIYYRKFSPSYDSATITVGYNKTELIGPSTGVDLPAIGFEPLLKKGIYQDEELVNAWQNIDFGNSPQAVLEIHYLNKDGSTAQNEIFVSYEQGA